MDVMDIAKQRQELIELMRTSLITMGRLSNDRRLNEEEQRAISFVAGYAAASLEEEIGENVTDFFYEGANDHVTDLFYEGADDHG